MSVLAARFMLSLLLLFAAVSGGAAEAQLLRPGDLFPEISLLSPAATTDRQYLQLSGERFTPSQISAELLLVELLNVYCPHCQMQTPAYNELYRLIEENPATRGRIKILGIAVGNQDAEIAAFRKKFGIKFPILADPGFGVWRKIGGSATPMTFYVRHTGAGKPGVVSGVHRGLNTDYRQLYAQLIRMAAADPDKLRLQRQKVAERQAGVQPIFPAEQLEYRVRMALIRFGTIVDLSELSPASGRKVYSAVMRRGEQVERLFAEVTSRTTICDVCHDVHFIYLFDRTTKVIGFEPLQLTGYGNVNWNEQQVEQMRKRVTGRYLSMPQPFDRQVDAISSATITSSIIFDSLAQGEELISELREQGFL